MKAIIAGGGIGGLVTALCLHDAGIECCVYESVETIKPLGVGINLLPHAMRVLTELGLEPLIEESAVETAEIKVPKSVVLLPNHAMASGNSGILQLQTAVGTSTDDDHPMQGIRHSRRAMHEPSFHEERD